MFRLCRCPSAASLTVAAWFSAAGLASGQSNEFRGWFADAWGVGFQNATEATQLIADTRAAHFNAIVPQVRRRGDAFYNSHFEPKNAGISSSYDPLGDLIAKAHNTNTGPRVEVHGWIVTYHIWQGSTPPPQPTHPLNLHPDWLLKDLNGNTFIGNEYTFDPGHPAVQQHTFSVCMDIITNYDVDGLNFDYIRYSSINEGYNDVTVARFNRLFGRTGQPATSDAVWKQFRRDQVTALLRKVYLNAIAVKPNVKISCDTITWAPGPANDAAWYSSSAAWNNVLQDWRGWMQEGIMDLNLPMAYFDQAGAYTRDWTNWCNFTRDHRFARHAAINAGSYLNYSSNAITQLRYIRSPSPGGNSADGICVYDYRTPTKGDISRATFINALVNPSPYDPVAPPVFAATASPPPMPWKSAAVKGHLMGVVYVGGSTNPVDGAVVSISGGASRSQTNDATGFYGFVDLPPGSYTVVASFPGYATAATNITTSAGAVATCDFQLNLEGPPAIIAQPQSQTVYAGAVANFTVSASGPGQLYYQWRLEGTNRPGATSSVLALNPATTNDAGGYDVVVTNSFGAVTSQVATLSVIVPPPNTRLVPLWNLAPGSRPYLTTGSTERGLTFNPVSGRLLLVGRAGSPQVYALNAETSADLHTLSQGSGIISGGTYTLQLTGAAADGAVYVCNLTLNGGTTAFKLYRWANDNPGTLPTVAFAGDPAPGTAQRWGDTIDVRGAGAGTQIIIASRSGTNVVVFTTANGTTFTAHNVNVSGVSGGAFGLGIAFGPGNSFYGKSISQPLRRVGFDLAAGAGSVLQTFGSPVVGNTVTAIGVSTNLSVLAGVAIETPDNLQLYDLPLAGTPSLAETNAFPTDNDNSNLTGAVDFGGDRVFALDSNNGLMALQILPPPTKPAIVTPPQSKTVVKGENATFFVVASGTAPLSYQWRFNGTNVSGASATNYTRFNVQAADAGDYTVVVTNQAGAVTSAVATLTVNLPPEITAQPQSLVVKVGANAAFSVTAEGALPLTYQWQFNGDDIPGATGSSYTRLKVQPGDEGDYSVTITNLVGVAYSTPATLTVLPPQPAHFEFVSPLADGSVRLAWSGEPNVRYAVDASSDLVAWVELAQVDGINGAFEFTDAAASNVVRRFYRARWTP